MLYNPTKGVKKQGKVHAKVSNIRTEIRLMSILGSRLTDN